MLLRVPFAFRIKKWFPNHSGWNWISIWCRVKATYFVTSYHHLEIAPEPCKRGRNIHFYSVSPNPIADYGSAQIWAFYCCNLKFGQIFPSSPKRTWARMPMANFNFKRSKGIFLPRMGELSEAIDHVYLKQIFLIKQTEKQWQENKMVMAETLKNVWNFLLVIQITQCLLCIYCCFFFSSNQFFSQTKTWPRWLRSYWNIQR